MPVPRSACNTRKRCLNALSRKTRPVAVVDHAPISQLPSGQHSTHRLTPPHASALPPAHFLLLSPSRIASNRGASPLRLLDCYGTASAGCGEGPANEDQSQRVPSLEQPAPG